MINVFALPALSELGKLKTSEIEPHHVMTIAGHLGVPMSEETARELSAVVQADDEDTLAAWLGRPDSLTRLREFVSHDAEREGEMLIECPHCSEMIYSAGGE
jgi:hypothetical protein